MIQGTGILDVYFPRLQMFYSMKSFDVKYSPLKQTITHQLRTIIVDYVAIKNPTDIVKFKFAELHKI